MKDGWHCGLPTLRGARLAKTIGEAVPQLDRQMGVERQVSTLSGPCASTTPNSGNPRRDAGTMMAAATGVG